MGCWFGHWFCKSESAQLSLFAPLFLLWSPDPFEVWDVFGASWLHAGGPHTLPGARLWEDHGMSDQDIGLKTGECDFLNRRDFGLIMKFKDIAQTPTVLIQSAPVPLRVHIVAMIEAMDCWLVRCTVFPVWVTSMYVCSRPHYWWVCPNI